jgi:hypothetical protein
MHIRPRVIFAKRDFSVPFSVKRLKAACGIMITGMYYVIYHVYDVLSIVLRQRVTTQRYEDASQFQSNMQLIKC